MAASPLKFCKNFKLGVKCDFSEEYPNQICNYAHTWAEYNEANIKINQFNIE